MKENQIKNVDSYYTTMYNYCLDIIENIVKGANWTYDTEANFYYCNIETIKGNNDKIVSVLNGSTAKKLDINELNNYFRIQNYNTVFNKVLKDLKISKRNNSNGITSLIVTKENLIELGNTLYGINQSVNHATKENNVEGYVKEALDLILNTNWYKDSMGYSITCKTYYDEDLNKVVVKVMDNNSGLNKILSYINLYMDKETYKLFNKELNDRLYMLGIDKYSYSNNNDKMFTQDIDKTRCEFTEYYGEGIKLKKLNY